ncbi:hypothetical protein K438DRAFT_668266 [Mycena galopus ATCC 62051]|nr:hypothetical protein K438DRAFT_668266 [Mycena galopus ATCC 62051]
MPRWKEFTAWISIGGSEAPEYGLEVSDDQKTVTCWIPSELGKKISVNWTNISYNSDTRGRVYMDGNLCGGKIIHPWNLPTTATKNGITNGISVKPFIFSSLEITDDHAFSGGPSHEELGVIKIKIEPVRVTERVQNPSGYSTSLSRIRIHEHAKKATSHQITFVPDRVRYLDE